MHLVSTVGNLPVMYDYENAVVSQINPNKVHVWNTALSSFFRRYLMQKAMSVFEWDLPETWEKNYFLYVLYSMGYISVIYTDRFGAIPQHCGLYGRGVMYQPTNAVISNPLLQGDLRPTIGQTCEIIRMQPDYGGMYDLVSFYADMMALTASGAASNINNSKLANVFAAQNQASAESYKKMVDQIESGDPASFIDKTLFDDQGKPTWALFIQNLNQNYIAGQMLVDLQNWENQFCTEVGLPNAATTANKERTSSFDVAGHNIETACRADMWLKNLQEGCKKVNNMFGAVLTSPLSVRWRYNPETDTTIEEEGGDDAGNAVNTRAV